MMDHLAHSHRQTPTVHFNPSFCYCTLSQAVKTVSSSLCQDIQLLDSGKTMKCPGRGNSLGITVIYLLLVSTGVSSDFES